MARAKQTARKQGARVPIDKGTYGSIKRSPSSSSGNAADKALSSGSKKKKKALSCAEKREKRKKKKEKERSSINSNGSAGNKKKKAAKNKKKTDNSTPSWVLNYQREQKSLKKNGNKKVPPKSARHHSTKKKRSSAISTSQQQRDFRATPYNSNPPYMSSNKKSTKYPGRTRPLPKNNINTPRKTRSGKLRLGLKKKLHCTSFTMSISECNDKVYLQKVDCPWYNSEILDGGLELYGVALKSLCC